MVRFWVSYLVRGGNRSYAVAAKGKSKVHPVLMDKGDSVEAMVW